jgi:hypothetical protein
VTASPCSDKTEYTVRKLIELAILEIIGAEFCVPAQPCTVHLRIDVKVAFHTFSCSPANYDRSTVEEIQKSHLRVRVPAAASSWPRWWWGRPSPCWRGDMKARGAAPDGRSSSVQVSGLQRTHWGLCQVDQSAGAAVLVRWAVCAGGRSVAACCKCSSLRGDVS